MLRPVPLLLALMLLATVAPPSAVADDPLPEGFFLLARGNLGPGLKLKYADAAWAGTGAYVMVANETEGSIVSRQTALWNPQLWFFAPPTERTGTPTWTLKAHVTGGYDLGSLAYEGGAVHWSGTDGQSGIYSWQEGSAPVLTEPWGARLSAADHDSGASMLWSGSGGQGVLERAVNGWTPSALSARPTARCWAYDNVATMVGVQSSPRTLHLFAGATVERVNQVLPGGSFVLNGQPATNATPVSCGAAYHPAQAKVYVFGGDGGQAMAYAYDVATRSTTRVRLQTDVYLHTHDSSVVGPAGVVHNPALGVFYFFGASGPGTTNDRVAVYYPPTA